MGVNIVEYCLGVYLQTCADAEKSSGMRDMINLPTHPFRKACLQSDHNYKRSVSGRGAASKGEARARDKRP